MLYTHIGQLNIELFTSLDYVGPFDDRKLASWYCIVIGGDFRRIRNKLLKPNPMLKWKIEPLTC